MKKSFGPPLVPRALNRPGLAKPLPASAKYHAYRGFFLLAVFLIFLMIIRDFIIPLTIGTIFATVLYPFMKKLESWRMRPWLAAIVVIFLFSVSFLLPIGILVFKGVMAAISAIQSIQDKVSLEGNSISIDSVFNFLGLDSLLDKVDTLLPFSQTEINDMILKAMKASGLYLSGVAQGIVANLPGFMLSTFIILVTVYFLLLDGKRTLQFIRENSFFEQRRTEQLFESMSSLCSSVVIASIAAGAVHAALMGLACLVTKTANPFLWALVTFFASFLPVVGTAPVLIFMILRSFMAGNNSSGIVFMVAALFIGIADNVVRPLVLRGKSEMHPLVGFIAAFGGLTSMGFYGLFIGPVVAGLFFQILPDVTKSFGKN